MLEENARAAIAASAAARAAEAERLSASLERVESRAARDVAQRGAEEKVLDAEAQAHARVAELRLQREADERERAHRAQLASRQQTMLLDAQRQQESWKTEDEERLLALKLSAATAERRVKIAVQQGRLFELAVALPADPPAPLAAEVDALIESFTVFPVNAGCLAASNAGGSSIPGVCY